MKESKVIPYHQVKEIVQNCKDNRTQALLAFQYAMGNRAGELAKEYRHKKFKKKRGQGIVVVGEFLTEGMRRTVFLETEDGLEWVSPNFKNKVKTEKKAWILKALEPWLYDVLRSWLEKREGQEFLFDIRHSRIKGLVDTELKGYDPEYHSHCLRHSRATHIADISESPFVVQEVLGHGDIRTSAKYIKIGKSRLKEKLGGRTFEDVLGRKV